MLRRSQASHFVPDAYVFPGGTLDASDTSPEAFERARGIDPQTVQHQFRAQPAPSLPAPVDVPTQREWCGLLIAGVRELFEEAGVLLACDAQGMPLSDADLASQRKRLHDARLAVQCGEERFDQILREAGVYANAAALSLFSQWITPPMYPRRYDTHFFVALASSDQAAAADTFETHDGVWIAPRAALEQSEAGAFRMVYPTIKHVERLARFESAQAVIDFARTKPIYRIMPSVPHDQEFVLPPELEYAW